MRVLLVAIGSYGDVFPFIGLGRALRERGHHVTLITNENFKPFADQEQIDFVELYSAQEYAEQSQYLRMAKPREARRSIALLMAKFPLKLISKTYELITQRYVRGETLVAAQAWAYGARIAQEKLGVPLATLHVEPICFRTIYDIPILPGWCPQLVPRLAFWVIDQIADRMLGSQINAFRAELGLPPVSGVIKSWWQSPQLVLGMFPDWFVPPQPDWPPNTELAGFPLYDQGDLAEIPGELDAFLSEGTPPLVFSQSSWMQRANEYFAVSAEAAARLGRRAILLTIHPDQIPTSLPPGVRHFRYIPYSKVLPRAVVHVHPGGIGTVAQSLAAGIPQLIVPVVADQPDNSCRLQRLGVSSHVRPAAYRLEKLTSKLQFLLESAEVAERCKFYAAKLRDHNALEKASLALERLHEKWQPRR